MLIAAAPIWTGPGIINTRGGGDSPFLFIRLQQLVANLRDGVFPARWMPDAAYGLGYPFFNYYASLPYYFAALFNFIGFDLLVSIKIVQTLGFVFAGWAMYRWADRHFSARRAAWLAAIAYVFAPFHFVNVYVRGDSLSEFYAFIFYPLILLSIDRMIEAPRSFPLLALTYGGLILTHNISALIFSPFALLYVLIVVGNRQSAISDQRSAISNQRSIIIRFVLGFLLAFALSAWFWLPALGEAPLVQLDNQTTGYFNYSEHFRSTDLIQSSIGFDYAINSAHTPFAMGLAQAIGTLAGLVALFITWKRDSSQRFRVFVLIGLVVSTFMITPLSRPLWDNLPLLPLAQFPWRFLSIQAFFTSIIIAHFALLFTPRFTPLALVTGLALFASMMLTLHPDYLDIRADEITPDHIQLYEAFTGNIGTTIRAEYLPRTTIPRPYTGPSLIDRPPSPHAVIARGDASAVQSQRAATRQEWRVTVNSDTAMLSFPVLYWPGWTAVIDGRSVEARPAPDLGYIQIDVPHGEHRVDLILGNTPIRTAGEVTSLAAVGLVLVGYAVAARRQPRRFTFAERLTAMLLPVIVLAVIAFVYQAISIAPNDRNDLTMDFVDKPWLHHNPTGGDFDGQARLFDYSNELVGSDTIAVSMTWGVTTAHEVTATIALEPPSHHVLGEPDTIAQQIITVKQGQNQVLLRSPYPLAAGMYYIRVQSGSTVVYLEPIWIKPRVDGRISHPFGKLTPAIGLAAVQTQHADRKQLDVLLNWSVSSVIDANYGISLRLRDASGKVWTSLDTQPGYGFQPTSTWQPGTINDAYTLNLPPDVPRNGTYSLDVILYRVASQQEVGRATIDGIRLDSTYAWQAIQPPAKTFTEPPIEYGVDANFADQIQLLGYNFTPDANILRLNLIWKAMRDIDANYKVFVHVFDPATEKIVAQSDAMPRSNTYATSRWITGEIVSDTIMIPLTNVPPGSYRIAIGLFDEAGRLPVSGSVGIDAENRRVILADRVEVR